MQTYIVGGAVRDELLGRPNADRDYVVVGATPEAMLAQGFRPVGKDFPVFLHPETHEEYALARTERKTGRGYHGFAFHAAPDVTLEDDLARRDLTINAMAKAADGRLIDPFDGQRDLQARVLRHVGPAFAEDPVRILRAARFVARLGFSVAADTLALMRAMAAAGEVDALVPERVWQELARGLMESDPVAMFALLMDAQALPRVAPEWAAWTADDTAARALREAARAGLDLPARFAAASSALEAQRIETLCTRLRVPADCRDLALVHARHREALREADRLTPAALAALVKSADGLRAPARFRAMVEVERAVTRSSGRDYDLQARRLHAALDAVRGVDAGAVVRGIRNAGEIQAALRAAHEAAIAAALA